MEDSMSDIVERCTEYLSVGGFFNPEMMDHEKVRDLVIDCRTEIERLREALAGNDLYVKTWSDDYDAMKIENERLREEVQKLQDELYSLYYAQSMEE
jgi:uncharacterized protein YtpQ (UPF0354 family)